ncbi:MAG TPA: hypothetical protein VI542_20050 [Candidatus Tectomicrobia bacterium]
MYDPLSAAGWYRRKVSEGTKGPIEYAFARQRVTLCKEGLPTRTVWLVIKRTLGSKLHWRACAASLHPGWKRPLRVASSLISSA